MRAVVLKKICGGFFCDFGKCGFEGLGGSFFGVLFL